MCAQDKKTFYVTTPIYYVNAKPHLGSLYSTLLADVAARIHQIYGQETYFLTGTDEHGQKVAEAAQQAGKEPKEFLDSLVPTFKKLWDAYELKYNLFIRTTDDYHVKAVQKWISELQKKGAIYKAQYEGWYDTSAEAFLTERDIEFQAEGQPPLSKLSGKPARWVSEDTYFFRLSAYQDRLLQFYEEHPEFVTPAERMHEVIAFVQSGLKDLSISRKTITWGIPFPGDEEHVTYVWADALNNYITSIGYGDASRNDEFSKWWPADLQILGKDILRFHAIYWPAFLMASDLPIPHRLLVHGWIKIDGQKMSKSLGNVIDPQQLAQEYGVEPVRYYLTRYMAVTQDSTFSTQDLEQKISSDLANDLGNLLNRLSTLVAGQGMQQILPPQQWGGHEQKLQQTVKQVFAEFEKEMNSYYFHRAYAAVWQLVHELNAYFHAQEPWKVAKTDKQRFEEIISAACHGLYAAALLIWPLMPTAMEKLLQSLGHTFEQGHDYMSELHELSWKLSYTITKIEPLFKKYETETMTEIKKEQPVAPVQDNTITIDDLLKVELLVGKIVEVAEVTGSDKLFKMNVDFGVHGQRTICAGIKADHKADDLMNKKTVFAFNLKPRKLMGIESQGMLLVAKNSEGKTTLVAIADSVEPGTRLG